MFSYLLSKIAMKVHPKQYQATILSHHG